MIYLVIVCWIVALGWCRLQWCSVVFIILVYDRQLIDVDGDLQWHVDGDLKW